MFEYPTDLKYADSHEYVRVEDGVATVGITAFAIDQLGDIVFLDLPEVGTSFGKGDTFGTVESVKAVEDVYAPVTGEVVAVNEALVDEPEQMGTDPYGSAWLIKIKLDAIAELEQMMSAPEYSAKVSGS
ncbi:Glycine cleavage system H protein [Thalassoporum mexicanum PCC 7367]|uniref:glycine cleavage system protein GcvH n=1 Tax=Thalassoporum mexicanum TaxID=3457544 RepID=UPI00029FA0CE|nr:glycine cleavage system protein GcvH [Pseudanabaena sp. PCC 7367]AFY69473.1 Glycine cleavage system H protein [Pseudanabaena sp. PCC 7367]